MITFPKYQPIANVVLSVDLNNAATQNSTDLLPTIGYIGFAEPQGAKAVIEIDSQGKILGTNSKAATKWANANTRSLLLIHSNLVAAHGLLPDNMTLTLVGYIFTGSLTLIDAQLAIDGKHSVYWLSVKVLNELVVRVSKVQTAFADNALFTEINFNQPELFVEAATQAADGVPMLWQISPHTEFAIAPVLRDPYRIAL